VPASFTREEIFSQLDESIAGMSFPDIGHGYNYPLDVRLHAYRDDARWAILVELVGYNPRACSVIDVIHHFGNCLDGPSGFENEDFLDRIADTELPLDEEQRWYLTTPVERLTVEGRGEIDVPNPAAADVVEMFRSLVPAHRDLLLADESELRRRIPADLPEVLRLEEWAHPDPLLLHDGDGVETTELWRLLADVLVTGDVTRYAPTEAPDSHWSNWPEGGSL
jgi:hypothetical protein